MRAGVGAIAQAPLLDGRWHGRADVLLRIDRPSELGGWSYEVVDTKLARETRAGSVLQLCLYSDLVGRIQGRLPEHMFIVSPGQYEDPQRFRTADFLAYYRFDRGLTSAAQRSRRRRTQARHAHQQQIPRCAVVARRPGGHPTSSTRGHPKLLHPEPM
jgi:predicted RecB family nuclease